MNMTMQPPISYPLYMDQPRPPLPMMPWSSQLSSPSPRQFTSMYSIPQALPPMVFPQQRYPLTRNLLPSSSYSNVRYQHLKQLANYPHRRPMHRSVDAPTRPHSSLSTPYRSSKTKSVIDFQPNVQFNSTHLSKAHSWHMMPQAHRLNLSVDYAKEVHLTPKRPRKPSLERRKKVPRHPHPHQYPRAPPTPPRQPSLPPKRQRSFRAARKRPAQVPKRGVVRISTLDEIPLPTDQASIRKSSSNNDRSSMKGSISNSSKRQMRLKAKPTNSRKNQTNNENDDIRMDSDDQSSSSSSNSRLSLQRILNGSLRNDPLIAAAMEDYRHLHRSSSQTTSLPPQRQNRSRNSLCSNSTLRLSPSPISSSAASSISRSHSQSSFTSVERLEIRQLIKTIKTKDTKSQHSSIPTSTLISEQHPLTTIRNAPPVVPMKRQRKSSVTEELDREFSKLRARDPNQELTYVTPSSICKRKKTNEKPIENIPPLPTFNELLRQVQLRPVDKSTKPICFKENLIDHNTNHDDDDDIYENPLTSIPVPRSSPIPVDEEEELEINKPQEIKYEYAVPIKKSEQKSFAQVSHFQPMRNFKLNKSIGNMGPAEKRASRSLSMLNWFQNNLNNPFPTTFQPNRTIDNYSNEYSTTSIKENIYTSDVDVDVYSPISPIEKNDDLDSSLQIHLDNQTIITDDFYSDYETKQKKTSSSSILNDFSHLFQRKHKHQNRIHVKNQRCSIM